MSSVVEDQSFHIAVEPAATALRMVKNVLEWAETNKEAFPSKKFCALLYVLASLTSGYRRPVRNVCGGIFIKFEHQKALDCHGASF